MDDLLRKWRWWFLGLGSSDNSSSGVQGEGGDGLFWAAPSYRVSHHQGCSWVRTELFCGNHASHLPFWQEEGCWVPGILQEGLKEPFVPASHDQHHHLQCLFYGLGDWLQHKVQTVPTLWGEHTDAFYSTWLVFFSENVKKHSTGILLQENFCSNNLKDLWPPQ